MVETKLARAMAPVRAAIAEGRIPGGILGLVTAEGARAVAVEGMAQMRPERRPLTRETWFDLASLTKVIFTTTRILDLAARGAFSLDDPLTVLIPDLRQYDMNAWERKVTFRQCLGHQTAFPGVEPIYTYGDNPDTLRAFVLQREWRQGPPVYSDINFILLGIALERFHGCRLRDLDPGLGFSFAPDPDVTAATEDCTWRGRVICGEVHDENCFALQGSGHAGLFGTIDAVLDYAQGLFDLPADHLIRTRLSPDRTHGWQAPHPGWNGGSRISDNAIGHTGFTGTGLWVDYDRGHAWSLLTNRVHPSRHTDSGIAALRIEVGDLINE
ncbi:serine hydrolase domain-containing protein [Oceaniglobus trochenteri]|uniref:serine hydrolase domain-containing protein n=1 Tax=Oceaniglobus trochenteri TaxID=2763260 RepID=UPI001CFFFD58|nr:serine hydrolase [Oceaniglobus trochenteri]